MRRPPGAVDEDVDAELDHYFAEAVRVQTGRGMSEQEALERARVQFGDEGAYRRALRQIDERRVATKSRTEALDTVARTLSTAFRRILRAPMLTASIVSILALGIGANAVMFSVVDRLLLSPPQHVLDADDVRLLHIRRVIFNGETSTGRTMTFPDYKDFTDVAAFAAVAAYTSVADRTVGRGAEARPAHVAGASASLFPLLGVQPAFGRFFSEEEDRVDAPPTAVLAHEYWTREFGEAPGAIGATIDVDQGRYTIVGVAPRGFTGASLQPVDIWVPLQTAQGIENGREWSDNRGWYWLLTVARLAPGATPERAALEATAAHRAGRQEAIASDQYDQGAEVLVAPIIAAQGPDPSSEAKVARLLAGVSLVVLLIACFNVANLLLARAVQARREAAVRLALGSGRVRLVMELVTESLMLAGLGAAAAALVARGIGSTIHQALLPNVAFADGGLGGRVLGFTVLTTLVAGLTTGLIPALQSSRTDLIEALRAGGRGIASGRSRTRNGLLVGQAALSVVLLVGAGLFVRSLQQARTLDLGFDARRVAFMSLEWNETLPAAERQAVYVDVAERLARLPGIRSAALTHTVPFRSSISLGPPRVPGLDSIPRHHDGGPYVNKVSSGYFETMGLSILQGRGLEPTDDTETAPPIAVVSESMARAIWPAGDALGACMLLARGDDTCTEVVGIVENHRRQALVEDDPHFMYYVNQEHPAFAGTPQGIMIGTVGDSGASLDGLRREARASSSRIRFVNLVSLADYVEPQMQSWKLGASMFSVFGALALIVAAWGLYCVLAFDVALRRHELGVRAALGAGVPRIVRLMLRQAMTLVGIGTAIGLVGATVAAGFIEPLLFRVSGTDATTFATVAATLMLVAGLAGSLPAWRAARIDPCEALQSD